MIDAVLTHPHSPLTCGVAKFSYQLANLLGVKCLPLDKHPVSYPLLSVKSSEDTGGNWPLTALWYHRYSLFLHDEPMGLCAFDAVKKAERVYAANFELGGKIRNIRGNDVIDAFCPSTVHGDPTRGAYKVLAFGMAHKLALDRFRVLKTHLDREHPDYTVSLSTAVHEGNPWDVALNASTQAMRQIFGRHLRVLGYLADDALAKELQDCDAVAVYFDPAVRENNTSVWAALSAGKLVYTNTDEHSPELDPQQYSWARLLETLS